MRGPLPRSLNKRLRVRQSAQSTSGVGIYALFARLGTSRNLPGMTRKSGVIEHPPRICGCLPKKPLYPQSNQLRQPHAFDSDILAICRRWRLQDQVLAMLRGQLADIILGAVFVFIASQMWGACSIAAIRRQSGVRLFIWLGIWSAIYGIGLLTQ